MTATPLPLNIVLLCATGESIDRIQHVLAQRTEFNLYTIRDSSDMLLAPTYDIHPQVVIIGPLVNTLQKIRWITRLRAVLPAVGIIAIGQFQDEEYGMELMALGANAFLAADELDRVLIPAIMHAAGRRL